MSRLGGWLKLLSYVQTGCGSDQVAPFRPLAGILSFLLKAFLTRTCVIHILSLHAENSRKTILTGLGSV